MGHWLEESQQHENRKNEQHWIWDFVQEFQELSAL
jgi:hypothetical protein